MSIFPKVRYPYDTLWYRARHEKDPTVTLADMARYSAMFFEQRAAVAEVSKRLLLNPQSILLERHEKNVLDALQSKQCRYLYELLHEFKFFDPMEQTQRPLTHCVALMLGLLPVDLQRGITVQFSTEAELQLVAQQAYEKLLAAIPMTLPITAALVNAELHVVDPPSCTEHEMDADESDSELVRWSDDTRAHLERLFEAIEGSSKVTTLLDVYGRAIAGDTK